MRQASNFPLIALSLFSVLLVGCAAERSHREPVRVCDDAGCSQRSASGGQADYVSRGGSKSADVQALENIAATQPRAAYDLALRYFRGDGVGANNYQALQWMRKAAQGGELAAQKALGQYYLTGLDEMGADPQEAQKWLTLAAAGGDRQSSELLEQAAAARQSEQDYYRLQQQWREVTRRAWHHDYPYYGIWREQRWYY